jgi:hypothetical protein
MDNQLNQYYEYLALMAAKVAEYAALNDVLYEESQEVTQLELHIYKIMKIEELESVEWKNLSCVEAYVEHVDDPAAFGGEFSLNLKASSVKQIVTLIKSRLAAAGRLRIVECPWCLTNPEAVAQAKIQALERFSFLSYHGFHCPDHAENFHELAQVDSNMRLRCCEAVVNDSTGLIAQMDNMDLED